MGEARRCPFGFRGYRAGSVSSRETGHSGFMFAKYVCPLHVVEDQA